MRVATFLHLEPSLFDAFPRVLGRLAPSAPAAPEVPPLRSLKWRLLSAQELAAPGFMTLHAERERGQVVDFVWDFASAPASRMLCHHGLDLVGKSLLDVFAGLLGRPAVFGQYRRVLEHGAAEAIRQVHGIEGCTDIYRHGAVRLGDGVAVTLINLSAVRRAEQLLREFTALQARATRSAQ